MKLWRVAGVLGEGGTQRIAQFFPPFDLFVVERPGFIISAKVDKSLKEWDQLGGVACFEIEVNCLIV